MRPRVGERLGCVGCETEVVVIRAPADELKITCGGHELVVVDGVPAGGGQDPVTEPGTLLGKRYADAETGLELLCTRSGAGTLEVGGETMSVKQAKSLPSSD